MAKYDETPNDQNYFDSYDNISVHNLMLRDSQRVIKYREAIFASKDLIKDKIVLDVGCGTGLLSLFCAQAGAKHVYGVEASKGIFELAKSIVSANGLTDRITLINSEIEKIPNLPVDRVDVIVSEWMGFYLLHESMLSSVIYARDKWLDKENGVMMPAIAYLYASPIEMTEYLKRTLSYWLSFEGLNYAPMAKVYSQMLLEKPLIECVRPEQLIDDEKMLASFDLRTCTVDDLKSIQSYDVQFSSNRDGAKLHGFVFWFDVVFRCDNDESIYLSTSPSSEPTHWKQTIAFLPEAIESFLNEKNDDRLTLKECDSWKSFFILNQNDENQRFYQIDIGVDLNSEEETKENDVNNNEGKVEDEFEDDEDEEEDDEEEDDEIHPIPCECGEIKCLLIKATLQKYESETQTKNV